MEARHTTLTEVLEGSKKFQIPIYQRTYDWHREHCKQLFDDILKIGSMDTDRIHFLGTITYVGEATPAVDVASYRIIDGQQRLTTLILLLNALSKLLVGDEKSVTKDKIKHLMFNVNENNADYYKLILTDDDDIYFKKILNDETIDESNDLISNFKYFKTLLSEHKDKFDQIWRGIKKLTVVTVMIDQKGDAQAIFESMNSTGLSLSETDMIQNYMLMSYDSETQKRIYYDYWKPMEQRFAGDDKHFDEFIRNYLMMKHGSIIPKKKMYSHFKKYIINLDKKLEIENMHKYSEYYANLIAVKDHSSDGINKVIRYIHAQETNVAYSLLLKILADHAAKKINEDQTKEIFHLVDSYLLRCYVCGLVKGGNKVFPELIPKIDETNYVKSIETALMSKVGNRRFPRDVVFRNKLKQIQLYTNRTICNYILFRLEHHKSKEHVEKDNITIEHIMPQTLTDEWKDGLGPDWKDTHESYIDNIGNLTLTGYNSPLGNESFLNKMKTYEKSNFQITRELKHHASWGKTEIMERANSLADEAIRIWRCPEELEGGGNYNDDALESDHLDGKESTDLWDLVKQKILSTCKGTEFHMKLHYGIFCIPSKNNSIVCSIYAQKYNISMIYNIKSHDHIIEPSGLVRDVSNIGHFASGDFQSILRNEDDVDMSVELSEKIWKHKSE